MKLNLLHVPDTTFLIDSNFAKFRYVKIRAGSFLCILRPRFISNDKDELSFVSRLDHSRISASAATSILLDYLDAKRPYWAKYKEAKQEFENNSRIDGFEVLNLNTLEKLWLSHYDKEALEPAG